MSKNHRSDLRTLLNGVSGSRLVLPLLSVSWLNRIAEFLHSLALALDGPGLFLVALADSSFLSIPEANDILIVVLSTGKSWERMAYYVAMTTTGSLVGCLLLYSLGRRGGNPLLRRRFSPRRVSKAEAIFRRWGLWSVAIPCLLPPPTPFKIFVLTAGVFRLRLSSFVAAILLGRAARYSMWGILAVLYGERVRRFMETRLPAVGMALFVLLVAAVLVAFVVWALRRRKGGPSSDPV